MHLLAAWEVSSLYFAVSGRAAARKLHRWVDEAVQRFSGIEAVLAVPGQLVSGEATGTRLPGWEMLWARPAGQGGWCFAARKLWTKPLILMRIFLITDLAPLQQHIPRTLEALTQQMGESWVADRQGLEGLSLAESAAADGCVSIVRCRHGGAGGHNLIHLMASRDCCARNGRWGRGPRTGRRTWLICATGARACMAVGGRCPGRRSTSSCMRR